MRAVPPACPGCCRGIRDPLLPGLLMGAVRLPDNLAKETLHINKHKQRQADPGNNRGEVEGGKQKDTHKQAGTYTHVRVQTK